MKSKILWAVVGLLLLFSISINFVSKLASERDAKTEAERVRVRTAKLTQERESAAAAQKLRCTEDIGTVLDEAKSAVAQGKLDQAGQVLNACTPWMTDPAAKALHSTVDAKLRATREAQATERARRDKVAAIAAAAAEKARKRREGVHIGMTQQDALDSSWGRPRKVNRTTTARGEREQWVYDGGYLYFEGGVLTTIQN